MARRLFVGIIVAVFLFVVTTGLPLYAKSPKGRELRAVTFQGTHVTFVDAFTIFKKRLSEATSGELTINYIGGPEAIPSFEQIEALRNGIVDMALLPAAYYVPHLPIVDGLKLSMISPWEERKTGAYDFLNKIHQERINAVYLGRFTNGIQFHFYLNKKIETPDLSGLKIRVTPVYKPFVEALGGIPVTTSPGEVYTALERGVVDGYGWPSIKISDFGWHEVTKYIINPGFYQVDVCILINLDAWRDLSAGQQEILITVAKKVEREASAHYAGVIKEERALLQTKGLKTITFTPEKEKAYRDLAYKSGWDVVNAKAPKLGPELNKMLRKK